MKVRVWTRLSSSKRTSVQQVPGLGRVLLDPRVSGPVRVGGPGLTAYVDTVRFDGRTHASVYAVSPD